ncbi:MAG: ribosome-associated translation inhibitor RaiA [Rhodothermaceae bacterium]|nr:ribosome-associated translation inhibitor RaiA [Rhodothermaceae bacterium]
MDTRITARHFNASTRLKEFALTRVEKLERFYDGITDARIILGKHNGSGSNKTAEITLNVQRQSLKAQDIAGSYEEAIDRCVQRLRRQILRYKGKRKKG